MTDTEVLAALNARGFFRVKPGLERIRAVLRVLGDPQNKVPSIHIAGTNGKGSVAAGFESVFRKAGLRTGRYTSPHLADVTERIALDGFPVRSEAFAEYLTNVFSAERRAKVRLTYFEITTAAAFLAFVKHRCQVAVVECGMGGLWDATNVIATPSLSVVTTIGLDHTAWLGKDEASIARQKAGILRSGVPLISGVRGSGRPVIESEAARVGAPLIEVDRDFAVASRSTLWSDQRQLVRYQGVEQPTEDFVFGLLGSHQALNAGIVIAGVRELARRGWAVDEVALRGGLRDVQWPGRFEVHTQPGGGVVLLDGAHNPPAMEAFLASFQSSPFRERRRRFLCSAYGDKDVAALGRLVRTVATDLHVARLPGERAASPAVLRRAFSGPGTTLRVHPNVDKACDVLLSALGANDLLVVTGSLALVGLVRTRLVQAAAPARRSSPSGRSPARGR